MKKAFSQKKRIGFTLLILSLIFIVQPAYAQSSIDEDILKLLRISGTQEQMEQVLDVMFTQFEQIPGVPRTYWVNAKQRMIGSIDDLLLQIVPIYRKHFTHSDIRELIRFYESPIGRKLIQAQSAMSREIEQIGEKWGEKVAEDVLRDLGW